MVVDAHICAVSRCRLLCCLFDAHICDVRLCDALLIVAF
jgi:hypothetical protein